MHMGYIFLGIAALNLVGVSGAALLMFAHGLSIAALFAMAGFLREKIRCCCLRASAASPSPRRWLAFAFGLAAFASIGLPGFANFASELTVFFGAFKPGPGLEANNFQLAIVFALWGVVISAVYMLRAYRAIFLGVPGKDSADFVDPVKSLRWPVILLLALLLVAGFAPGVFLAYVQPSIQALLPK